jgi:heterodisulfide reductase subunit D
MTYLARDRAAAGQTFDILFWVGCAGAFDDRYRRVTATFARLLEGAGVSFAVLGDEEACSGDPARRSGNEFQFQMLATQNIQTMDMYGVKKVVTACPHCFNTIKNEYPELGGNYEVLHHSQLLIQLLQEGKIVPKDGADTGRIVYHDSCYLGRGNDVYEAPREIITALKRDLVELKRSRAKGLCCGAGGAQMWKEPEAGNKDINIDRIEEVLAAEPAIVAVACPFCMTMMSDGVKNKEKEETVRVLDLSEIVAQSLA